MYDWVVEHGINKFLIAIGADSTNLNTGCKGGVIKYLENNLGRRFIRLICALHSSELPIKYFIAEMNRKPTPNNAFSDNGDRRFADETIRKLCGSSQVGHISVKYRKNPKLNTYATKQVDLHN